MDKLATIIHTLSCSNYYVTKDVTSPQKKKKGKKVSTSRDWGDVTKGVLYMYGGKTSGENLNSEMLMHGYNNIRQENGEGGRKGMQLRHT